MAAGDAYWSTGQPQAADPTPYWKTGKINEPTLPATTTITLKRLLVGVGI